MCIRAYRQTVGCQGSEGGPRSHARKGVVSAFFGPNRNDMTNRANWGLKEYRKYDPQALSDDPELYARLREKEYGEEQEPYHNLAYYRKHNPEYLAQHPDQYERLLARERKNK